MTLKVGQVKSSPIQTVMHRPILSLIACASGRSRRIHSWTLRGARKISIEKPELSGLDIFRLNLWPGLRKKLLAIPAGEVGIFDQRKERSRIPAEPDIGCSLLRFFCPRRYSEKDRRKKD
jgi:hypothetical protein